MTKRFGAGLIRLLAGAVFAANAAGIAATPSFAQELMHAQDQVGPNCTCRYRGQDFQLGDRVCLSSPDGPQQAECGFVLNNTSWNFTGLSCAYSSYSAPDRSAAPPAANLSPVPAAALRLTLAELQGR